MLLANPGAKEQKLTDIIEDLIKSQGALANEMIDLKKEIDAITQKIKKKKQEKG